MEGSNSPAWLERLAAIGVDPDDEEDERLAKSTLTLTALSVTVLAILWVGGYLALGRPWSAAIPFIFQVTTIAGLIVTARTKRSKWFRLLILTEMAVLPVALQWTLGGFAGSGAVIVWAFVAPLAAYMLGVRPWPWLALFVALVVASGVADPWLSDNVDGLSAPVARLYFVLNTALVATVVFLALRYFTRQRDTARLALRQEQARSDRLLLNVLPPAVAERLKAGEEPIADAAAHVTVLFADLVDFTPRSDNMKPDEVVTLLNDVFSAVDELATAHGVEKIKTIGDGYMVVAGVPEPVPDHAQRIAGFALDVLDLVRLRWPELGVRIGIDTGAVVAGVIGHSKFSYDLWGDTVNIAARMESHGAPGRIQVTRRVADALGGEFVCQRRGVIDIKGKGEMETYLLVGRASGPGPPDASEAAKSAVVA